MSRFFRDNITFLITVLTAFGGIVVYGESRLTEIDKAARAELRLQNDGIEKKLANETQQRREDIREVNEKLDRIIWMIARIRR